MTSLVLTGCATVVGKDGTLGTVLELKSEQDAQESSLKELFKAYDRAVTNILSGDLKEGMSASEVERMLGEPAVQHQEDEGAKWVYRNPEGGWFGGEKVYLYFGPDKQLMSWECVHVSCETS